MTLIELLLVIGVLGGIATGVLLGAKVGIVLAVVGGMVGALIGFGVAVLYVKFLGWLSVVCSPKAKPGSEQKEQK